MMKPYVVDHTVAHDGARLSTTEPEVWKRPMTPETAFTLNALMQEVVNTGTASCCMQLDNGVQAAAKTGTAQLNNDGEPERSNAWITAFAPAGAPEVRDRGDDQGHQRRDQRLAPAAAWPARSPSRCSTSRSPTTSEPDPTHAHARHPHPRRARPLAPRL